MLLGLIGFCVLSVLLCSLLHSQALTMSRVFVKIYLYKYLSQSCRITAFVEQAV